MKKAPVADVPALDSAYKIIEARKKFVLVKPHKRGTKMDIVYKCKAQSLNGAIRESVLKLEGKL